MTPLPLLSCAQTPAWPDGWPPVGVQAGRAGRLSWPRPGSPSPATQGRGGGQKQGERGDCQLKWEGPAAVLMHDGVIGRCRGCDDELQEQRARLFEWVWRVVGVGGGGESRPTSAGVRILNLRSGPTMPISMLCSFISLMRHVPRHRPKKQQGQRPELPGDAVSRTVRQRVDHRRHSRRHTLLLLPIPLSQSDRRKIRGPTHPSKPSRSVSSAVCTASSSSMSSLYRFSRKFCIEHQPI